MAISSGCFELKPSIQGTEQVASPVGSSDSASQESTESARAFTAATKPTEDQEIVQHSAPSASSTEPLPTVPFAEQSLQEQEQTIQSALDKLSTGSFFHNIPLTMRVNTQERIEAGILEEGSTQVRSHLQGRGDVVIKESVRYNPLGVNIQLKVDNEAFQVNEISGGFKPLQQNDTPPIWRWDVIPKKQGKHNVILTATVNLNIPELERDYEREYIVYQETVKAEVNLSFSVQQYLSKHWKQLLLGTLTILVGLLGWWMALRSKLLKPVDGSTKSANLEEGL